MAEWGGQVSVPGIGPGWRRQRSFVVGVDYYPSDDERRALGEYYPHDAGRDFAAMAEAGISLVRVFVSWRRFEPEVGRYDAVAEDRFADVLGAAAASGLKVIVSFFADDGLSDMNAPLWARNRDPHADPYLLQRHISLVHRVVGRHRAEPAVWAWELGNQAFFAGFGSTADLRRWASALHEAIREVDPARAIVLGVDPEALLLATGVDARPALVPFDQRVARVTPAGRALLGPGGGHPGALTRLTSFFVRLAEDSAPVLADALGAHTAPLPGPGAAAQVRAAGFAALTSGAAGVLAARWRDVETVPGEPERADAWELRAGLLDTAGRPKPALAEMTRIAQVAAALNTGGYAPAPARATVLVPAVDGDADGGHAVRRSRLACFHAYLTAREAHVPATLSYEGSDLAGYSTVFIPAPGRLGEATCAEVTALVRSGGSALLSWDAEAPRDLLREVFGVEMVAEVEGPVPFVCNDARAGGFTGLPSVASTLVVPRAAVVRAAGARVAALGARGEPVVTVHRFGRGTAVFIAAPVELALGEAPATEGAEVRQLLRSLYRFAAREAGAAGFVACDTPDVETALFVGESDDVLFVLNHSPVARTPIVTAGRTVASVAEVAGTRTAEVGAQAFGVPLKPYGVRVLRVSYG